MKLDPAKIAASNARAEKPARSSAFRRDGVSDSMELRRILSVPRRTPERATPQDREDLSALLCIPGGTMTLNTVQATVLAELHTHGRAIGSICAGGGKTLLSFLIPYVMQAKRPLILVPSGLVQKTYSDFGMLARHWQDPGDCVVFGYEALGRERAAKTLEAFAPDLIIADEAHRLKNKQAACTRRVKRYLEAHPETLFVPFSGTLIGAALEHCAHLYEWALGPYSPLPRRFVDIAEWGLAVDLDVPAATIRFAPGHLSKLYNDEERAAARSDEIATCRRAVQRRIEETPGVVATHESYGGASLRVNVVPLKGDRPKVEAAMLQLEKSWLTPDGEPISDASSKWRHGMEILSGFHYVWDPKPPQSWLGARRAWKSSVRHILAHNAKQLDSELQVARAVERGEYDEKQLNSNGMPLDGDNTVRATYEAWRTTKTSYEPKTRALWLDDDAIAHVRAWAKEGPGIVFVGFIALGERIAVGLGLPYYGQGGVLAGGAGPLRIDNTTPADGPVVASLAANYTGRNLQAWNRALVLFGTGSATANAMLIEQLLARMHREGQRADEVTYDFLITGEACYAKHLEMLEEAKAARDLSGQAQRILFADVVDEVPALMLKSSSPLWVSER